MVISDYMLTKTLGLISGQQFDIRQSECFLAIMAVLPGLILFGFFNFINPVGLLAHARCRPLVRFSSPKLVYLSTACLVYLHKLYDLYLSFSSR